MFNNLKNGDKVIFSNIFGNTQNIEGIVSHDYFKTKFGMYFYVTSVDGSTYAKGEIINIKKI